jgi:phosphoribosyl-AMP cyclohydrolase
MPPGRHRKGLKIVKELEEGVALTLDFGKLVKITGTCTDAIPVAVQHADTHEVILVAYTNERAMRQAFRERTLVLWSTSRNELWEKGKTSGETFDLVEARVNCEQNSLLYIVRPRRGGICHTRNRQGEPRNCYYRRIHLDTLALENTDP